ncbi:MAG: hydroxymethylbilane synthase [Flavobacteriales bacterium]
MNREIIIGSRGSELALWQAHFVQAQLTESGIKSRIEIIKTKGDQIQHLSFDKIEGKGFFTKELETALLENKIDLAVHSCKDLETSDVEGLSVAAYSYRENPADCLLIKPESIDNKKQFKLKQGAVVGTSSARRKEQLLAFRPDIITQDIRGNVPTRIQKLLDGEMDAIMLAKAGIARLKIDVGNLIEVDMDPRIFIPAPAQGVLALQIRENDSELASAIQVLNHSDVASVILAERKLLNLFEGGCQLPFGAYCEKINEVYHYKAAVKLQGNNHVSRIYLQSEHTESIAPLALAKLTADKSTKRVFITRDKNEAKVFFSQLESEGIKVLGNSMTRYEMIAPKFIPQSDWIFFSSKNCVNYFFENRPQLKEGVKFGCVGEGTAKTLLSYGYSSDFTGKAADTELVGKLFAKEVGAATVLFPQSTASYRTVQKQFSNPGQVVDLVVYDTLEQTRAEAMPADVVVLTSPTNAILYLRKMQEKPNFYIVMGPSTAEVLESRKITNYSYPHVSSELTLAEVVVGVL